MSFTYSKELSNPLSWVRFWVGDTGPEGQHRLQDEEIAAMLTAEGGNQYLAAYNLGLMLYTKHGAIIEKQVGDLRVRWSESKGTTYLDHLRWLRAKGLGMTTSGQSEFRVLA